MTAAEEAGTDILARDGGGVEETQEKAGADEGDRKTGKRGRGQ
jgi:hypothetical protein